MNNIKVQENSATGRFPVLGIAAIALFLRLLLAWITPLEKSFDDVYFFILPWMQNMHHNGVLAMYQEAAGAAWAMDYPPLYYLSLYFTTGKFAAIAADAGKMQLAYCLKN
jgi:ligand-binding sensor domain-containing protein